MQRRLEVGWWEFIHLTLSALIKSSSSSFPFWSLCSHSTPAILRSRSRNGRDLWKALYGPRHIVSIDHRSSVFANDELCSYIYIYFLFGGCPFNITQDFLQCQLREAAKASEEKRHAILAICIISPLFFLVTMALLILFAKTLWHVCLERPGGVREGVGWIYEVPQTQSIPHSLPGILSPIIEVCVPRKWV